MSVYRIMCNVLGGAIPLVLLALFVVGCGSSTTTSGAAASAPTATACPSLTVGTIQSVSSTAMQVTTTQGKTVQATFTSKTTFTRPATLTAADLKTGMPVTVVVKQNPDNSYSALTVSVRTSLTNSNGFTRGSASCNGRRPRGNGTPGANGGNRGGFGGGAPGSASGQSRQTINGTVSQINGSSFVVTDTSSNDFTVTLTTTTRISTQQTITASDLHAGETVTITGSANSQGVINASSVSLLQGVPFRQATPTATVGA